MLAHLDEDFAETLTGYVVVLPGEVPGAPVRATDCQIWDCTEKAARLYGYPSADALKGQYKSLLCPQWEQDNSQFRATAVHLGRMPHANDEATSYVRRPDGEEVAVDKTIVTTGGTSGRPVWHTRLRVRSQHVRKRALKTTDCGVTRQEVTDYCGDYTAYSLHKVLHRLSILDMIIPETFRLRKLRGCIGVALRKGGSRIVKRLYRCLLCQNLWFAQRGKTHRPGQCPSCGSEVWWRDPWA